MKNWLFLIFVITQTFLFAQNTEIGILLGTSGYTGDIEVSPKGLLPQLSLSAGIYGRQYLSEKFAVRAVFSAGGLKGDEKKYPTSRERELRGFNFKATFVDLALLPEWRIFNAGNVRMYIFGGLAGTYVNPKSYFNELSTNSSNANIAADKGQKYPKIALAVPVGGGLNWFMNETTTLGAEFNFRKTFTDYLDGFSASANPKSKDYYYSAGITFSKLFSFGNNRGGIGGRKTGYKRRGVSCPTFR